MNQKDVSIDDIEVIIVNTKKESLNLGTFGENVHLIEAYLDCERVIGRNLGMRKAIGDWICWLDSDDEYTSNYFSKLNQAMEEYSEAVCFNFGALVHWHGLKSTVRQTFKPQELGSDSFKGMEFKSGRIATGSFVFKRSLLNEIGYLQESVHPYGDSESFSGKSKNPNYLGDEFLNFPPMGNPWGCDYQMFYQITRKYDSQPLDLVLYLQNVR